MVTGVVEGINLPTKRGVFRNMSALEYR